MSNSGSADAGETQTADVLIVGAGVAGLTAARELTKRNVGCLVLEARDRVGGRTLSQKVGRDWLDLGGQWIGPTQDRLAALARELQSRHIPATSGRNQDPLLGRQDDHLSRVISPGSRWPPSSSWP